MRVTALIADRSENQLVDEGQNRLVLAHNVFQVTLNRFRAVRKPVTNPAPGFH